MVEPAEERQYVLARCCRLTTSVITAEDMPRVQDLVVVGESERVRISRLEAQRLLYLILESDEPELSEKTDFIGLAHDGDQGGKAVEFSTE